MDPNYFPHRLKPGKNLNDAYTSLGAYPFGCHGALPCAHTCCNQLPPDPAVEHCDLITLSRPKAAIESITPIGATDMSNISSKQTRVIKRIAKIGYRKAGLRCGQHSFVRLLAKLRCF